MKYPIRTQVMTGLTLEPYFAKRTAHAFVCRGPRPKIFDSFLNLAFFSPCESSWDLVLVAVELVAVGK